uniref:Uncharacterized protein n=1 Tax=Vitis vinifera TaxID=29760 RepID=F6HTY3_VITVI
MDIGGSEYLMPHERSNSEMEAVAKSVQQSNIVPGALEESKISAVKEDTM